MIISIDVYFLPQHLNDPKMGYLICQKLPSCYDNTVVALVTITLNTNFLQNIPTRHYLL